MKVLYVTPAWSNDVRWVNTFGCVTAYAGHGAALTGHHFDEVHLCMPEFARLFRHDLTLDDVIGRYCTRLKMSGSIVLDYESAEVFFNRRPR